VTEPSARAASEDRGHPNTFESELAVPHRVHPSMDPSQVPTRDPILDEMPAKPRPQQLATRDHAMLTPSQNSERPVDKCTLCRYIRY
jgi:hypothetical protein